MKEAVIVSGVRTAVGRAPRGTLRGAHPADMTAASIKEALRRANDLDPSEVEDVIIGCAMPEGPQGYNIARQSSIRAGLPEIHSCIDQPEPVVDHFLVPASAVLILQQHQLAVLVHPSMAAGVLEQHQREQTHGLGFPRHEPIHDACQPDRLLAKLDAQQLPLGRGVALVKHQVQDAEHTAQAFGQEFLRRHSVWDPCVPDLALRPDQTLLYCMLSEQECASDLA